MSPSFEPAIRQTKPLWSVPIYIRSHNKWSLGITLAFTTAFLYLSSNHFHILEPQLLPLTWIDQSIPFIPETVWIYCSEYFLFFAVYWTCKDQENLNRYAYSFMAQQIFSVLIFWVWPTTYPRELFALPESLNPLTTSLFQSLRTMDTPANCCPSLHVSSVYLSSMMFLHEQRAKFPFFFLWATAVALSTLTTKQHYLIDVITGLLMAVCFFWFFSRRVSYRDEKR